MVFRDESAVFEKADISDGDKSYLTFNQGYFFEKYLSINVNEKK